MKNLKLINENSDIFEKMHKSGLLTSGKIDNFNTMTIGWGTCGVLWSMEVFIVYVRPSRHTYKYMEENDYFTVSFFSDEYKKSLGYLGTRSGKDTNKVYDVGFTPIEIGSSVTFKEANLTILCKKLYFQDLDETKIPKEVLDRTYKDECYHRYYVGQIIEVKQDDK